MWRMSVLALLWLLNSVLGFDESFEEEHAKLSIIDGNTTSIELHPYQVSIWCGKEYRGSGALLSGRWVVTTASTVVGYEVSRLKIRFHSSSPTRGGRMLKVSRMLPHPRFNYSTMEHDVALLLLRVDHKLPTKLSVRLAVSPLPDNSKTLLSGWGSTTNKTKMSDTLQQVWERTISSSSCQKVYNQSFQITKGQFCTEAIDAFGPCWGDNGDLLVAGGKLYGLLSWNQGCFDTAAPSVFTQMSSVRPWILRVIRKYHPHRKAKY